MPPDERDPADRDADERDAEDRRAGRPPGPDGDRTGDEPHPSRLPPDHPGRGPILAAHRAAVDAGEPGYLDPATGLFVLTASYLAERGRCCDTGCRHCPFVA
jgi:hypothetical protein